MYMEHADSLALNLLVKNNDRILVAFSGGPDSVFLVKKLLEFKKYKNFEFAICYINHKLRDEAYLEEEWVKNFARKYNLNYYIKRVDVKAFSKKKKISIETAGRILRYRILNYISKRENYNKIATAHHLNDAFETFILNSIRGSGIFGIVLKPKYKNIIRPIILYSKEEILNSLEQDEYIIDRTNFESIFSRNFIRNEVISKIKLKFPNYIKGFKKTYLNLLEISKKLQTEMKAIYKKSLIFKSKEIKIFKREVFLNLSDEKIKLFFSKIIKEPSFEHLNEISKIIKNEGKINIKENYFFEVRGNFIGIYKNKLKFNYFIYVYPKPYEIQLNELKILIRISEKPVLKPFCLNFNIYKIFSPIIIRKRKKGDRIGNKKLKEILINYKIPNFLKDFLPVIQKDDKIIFPIKPYLEKSENYLIIEFVFKNNFKKIIDLL